MVGLVVVGVVVVVGFDGVEGFAEGWGGVSDGDEFEVCGQELGGQGVEFGGG